MSVGSGAQGLEEARAAVCLLRFEVRGHRGTTVVCSRATLIGSKGSIPAVPAVPAPPVDGLSDEQALGGGAKLITSRTRSGEKGPQDDLGRHAQSGC